MSIKAIRLLKPCYDCGSIIWFSNGKGEHSSLCDFSEKGDTILPESHSKPGSQHLTTEAVASQEARLLEAGATESAWSEKQWARFRDLAQVNDDNRYPLGSVGSLFTDPIAIPAFGGVSWETKTYSEAKENDCTVVIENGIVWLDFNKDSQEVPLLGNKEIDDLITEIKAAVPWYPRPSTTITSVDDGDMWHVEVVYSDPTGDDWDTIYAKTSMKTHKNALKSALEIVKTKFNT